MQTGQTFLDQVQLFFKSYGMTILSAVIVLVVGFILIKALMKITARSLKRSKVNVSAHKFMLSILKIFLWVILVLTILQMFGVPTATLIAALGVFGLAVSLAVQNSLSNVAGGLLILFSKPFEVGNYVKIGDTEGTVIAINILHTKLNTVDNKAVYIPNGQISNDKVINFTREQTRRLDLIFPISYQDDFEQAKKLIAAYIATNSLAMQEPAPFVRVCEFADSSVNLAVRVWVNCEDYWNLYYDMLEQVKHLFDRNGIHMPYQKMDVIVHQPALPR